MGSTKLNLLYNVGFNQEVAKESALYWNREDGNLSNLINKVDNLDEKDRDEFYVKGRKVIRERYSWEKIVSEYEKIFLDGKN